MAYIKYGTCEIFSDEENSIIVENERMKRLFSTPVHSKVNDYILDGVFSSNLSDAEKLSYLTNSKDKIVNDEKFYEILKKAKEELENLYMENPELARNRAQIILLLIGAIDEYNNILIPFDGVVNNNVDEESNDVDFPKKNESFKKKFRNFVRKLGIKNK